MPYQSSKSFFAALRLREDSSPKEKACKIPLILAWIESHREYRLIALIQTLQHIPFLYNELR